MVIVYYPVPLWKLNYFQNVQNNDLNLKMLGFLFIFFFVEKDETPENRKNQKVEWLSKQINAQVKLILRVLCAFKIQYTYKEN